MTTRSISLLLAASMSLTACSDPSSPTETSTSPVETTRVTEQSPPTSPDASGDAATPQAAAGAALADAVVPVAETAPDGVRELDWDALIPDDFRPDKLMETYNVDDLSDDDPRAAELMDKLKALWDQAPVREDLDGADIKLPGFIVPVEADEKETTGFLLVPYYGACVHVPPPPANQTVYVLSEAGKGTKPELFDVVWVTGNLQVKRIENDVAEAGYTLYATKIEPYE